jgi:hypothetical protein
MAMMVHLPEVSASKRMKLLVFTEAIAVRVVSSALLVMQDR